MNLQMELDGIEYLVDANSIFSSSTPKITKVILASKLIEYEHEFQEGVKQFIIMPVSDERITYAFVQGETTGDQSFEYDRFECFEQKFLSLPAGTKIYMRSDSDNTILKVLEWK